MQHRTNASGFLKAALIFFGIAALGIGLLIALNTPASGQAVGTLPQLVHLCRGADCDSVPLANDQVYKYLDELRYASAGATYPGNVQTQAIWQCVANCDGVPIPRVTGIVGGAGISTTIGVVNADDTLCVGWFDNDHPARTMSLEYDDGELIANLKAGVYNIDTGNACFTLPRAGTVRWGPSTESGYGHSEIVAAPEATATETATATPTLTPTLTPAATITATATALIPTATAEPPTVTATSTPLPPTPTATATQTGSSTQPTPTATPHAPEVATVEPTATATPVDCESAPHPENCPLALPVGDEPLRMQFLPLAVR